MNTNGSPLLEAKDILKAVDGPEGRLTILKPARLAIRAGDTVTWVNQALMDHNIISFPDGYPEGAEALRSPYLSKEGESWSYTFTQSGTYDYHCLPHLTLEHGDVLVRSRMKDHLGSIARKHMAHCHRIGNVTEVEHATVTHALKLSFDLVEVELPVVHDSETGRRKLRDLTT